MTINKKAYFLLILLFGIIIFIYYKNTYTEFEPILFRDDAYKRVAVDRSFYKNLKIVFDYDNVQYKVNKQGKTLVKRKLNDDKELVFNYTEKALDTIWLNSHKYVINSHTK
jgi:hypothetical protein